MRYGDKNRMYQDNAMEKEISKTKELKELIKKRKKQSLEKRDLVGIDKDIKKIKLELSKIRKEG